MLNKMSDTTESFRLHRGDTVASYTIREKLGEGAFGKVYSATDAHGRNYAVKLAKKDDLHREKKVYSAIGLDKYGVKALGVPRMHYFGSHKGHDVLVLQMLGSSLYSKAKRLGKFSLKTCYMIAFQAIRRIEHIHERGFLHRDIKPDNILTGRPGYNQRRIFIIDYGLAKKFRDEYGRHVPKSSSGLTGTVTYSSLNVMNGVRASRRDDLESLAYALLDLRKGLPWSGIVASEQERIESVFLIKNEMPLTEICEGFPGMVGFLRYVRRLGYKDRPSYRSLIKDLQKAMQRNGLADDGHFDWVEH